MKIQIRSVCFILSAMSILLSLKSEARPREKAKDRAERMKREMGQGAEIGIVRISGSGCPEGTVAAVLSPDKKALSVLFDAFVVERGPNGNVIQENRRERVGVASCQIEMPFNVPPGMKARIASMDVRGFVALPEKSRALVVGIVRFFKRPKSHASNRFEFVGPMEDVFNVRTINAENTPHSWTLCGVSENVFINTNISLNNHNPVDMAHVSVDSADLVAEDTTLNLAVEWQRCR